MRDQLTPGGTSGAVCDAVVVATTRRWVAEDLRPAADAAGIPLVYSPGFDVPDLQMCTRPAWWTPTEHAARLIRSGVDLPLVSVGPAWLSGVSEQFTGRPVWSGTLHTIGDAPRSGWCKPAEFKHEKFPAAWWNDTIDFGEALRAAGIPGDSGIQVSPVRLVLGTEYRFFVVHGRVVGGSAYLEPDGTTWHEDMVSPNLAQACAFATVVAACTPGPPAYTLDVAEHGTGWVVLEGNPVFSSAMYGTPPTAVLAALIAAVDYDNAYPAWVWDPDPYLKARAARQSALPRRTTPPLP